ncbi:MAG: hypothetical protein MI746_05550 [Pseudomonadales bacterium]|nr:hypothetical protein [Pseudomonadales bacterium]
MKLMKPEQIGYLALIFALPIAAQQESEPEESQTEAEKPYEIVVTPTLSRAGLRNLISNVEEDFYEKFNELNIDDSFDIVCYKFNPTMSHITQRVCEPTFMLKYRGENASEATFLLGSGNISAALSGLASLKTERQLFAENRRNYDKLQELMEEFYRTDTEFRQIGEVLGNLKTRLENYGQDQ